MKIIMTKERFKRASIDNNWKRIDKVTKVIGQQEYNNITSSDVVQFFQCIGSNEVVRFDNVTGKVNKIESTCPSKTQRSLYSFEFV